jgi:biotin transport system substrate-specific component
MMDDLRTATSLTQIAVMAAVIVVLGLIPPFFLLGAPVPVTAQTLGVMLAGILLGGRRGAAAAGVVVLLVAVGLPVLSGGRGGLGVLYGPTAGFLLGWVPGAWVTGVLAHRSSALGRGRVVGLALAAVVGGIGVVYTAGALWLVLVADFDTSGSALWLLLAGFLPGDTIKVLLAAVVAEAVLRQQTLVGALPDPRVNDKENPPPRT